jgi:hypothetical protein
MTAVRISKFKAPDGSFVDEDARIKMVKARREHSKESPEYEKLNAAIAALVPILPGEIIQTEEPITEQTKLAAHAKSVFFQDDTADNPFDGSFWLPVRVYSDPYEPEVIVKTTVSSSL